MNLQSANTSIRIKYLFKERIAGAWGEEPTEDNSVVCIRAADFETDKLTHKRTDLSRRSFKEEEIKKKSLEDGDLIIEKSGGGDNQPVGRVILFSLEEPALCSNFLEILRPDKKRVETKFVAYLMYSYWITRKVTSAIKQTTGIQNLDISEYFDLKVELPELKVQNIITEFLDKEIAHIDSLIASKENLINVLAEKRKAIITHAVTKGLNSDAEMKDSGIEWLGKVPKHWTISKIKYVTTKIGSGVTPKGGAEVYQKEGIPLIRSQNIHFDGLRLDEVVYISEDIHESMSNSKVENGDVLLNITGASIGRVYFFEGQFSEANVNQHVCILRPNNKVLTQYLYLFLASLIGQNQIAINQVGGGREGLNFENLKSFITPIPDLDEQKEIIEYINVVNDELKELEDQTHKSINLLRERRSALITSVVTGQLKIPKEDDN